RTLKSRCLSARGGCSSLGSGRAKCGYYHPRCLHDLPT
ncbi:ORFL53W.iORF1, partial [Human betaherpesvirus 5]